MFGFILLNVLAYSKGYPCEKDLHHDLFANYSKLVFPSDALGQPVNISIHTKMNYIIGWDEKTQLLTSDLQLTVTWKDGTLVWEETEYGGIKDIHVPVGQMWVPDLAIHNALTDRRRLVKDDQVVQVNSNGTLKWMSDYIGRVLCPLTMTNYPFDSQNCQVFIEILGDGSGKVKIVAITAPPITDVFPNGQWELMSTFSELTEDSAGDSVALITLHIKRRQKFYVFSIVLPTVVATCLNPFVFLLPTESGEKVALSTTMLLFYSFMLTYILDNIPVSSHSMPTLCFFIGGQLVLSALSLVCTVVVLHFRHSATREGSRQVNLQDGNIGRGSLNVTGPSFFRRINAMLFAVFSLAEGIICLTIYFIIQN